MKGLLINGSPNMKGCTYTALTEVEKILNEAGINKPWLKTPRKRWVVCSSVTEMNSVLKIVLLSIRIPTNKMEDQFQW